MPVEYGTNRILAAIGAGMKLVFYTNAINKNLMFIVKYIPCQFIVHTHSIEEIF